MSVGPKFYVVKLVLRPDGTTIYLADYMDKDGGRHYARVNLTDAVKFTDRDMAVLHMEVFCEHLAEVVELRAVVGEIGDWKGWHSTQHSYHGPDGCTVTYSPGFHIAATVQPWVAYLPDGRIIRDTREKPRTFKTAMAARRAAKIVYDKTW